MTFLSLYTKWISKSIRKNHDKLYVFCKVLISSFQWYIAFHSGKQYVGDLKLGNMVVRLARPRHIGLAYHIWEVVFKCPYRKEVYLKHSKRKGNISIEKGIRSKVKCRSSAHFPSIWGGSQTAMRYCSFRLFHGGKCLFSLHGPAASLAGHSPSTYPAPYWWLGSVLSNLLCIPLHQQLCVNRKLIWTLQCKAIFSYKGACI